MLYKLEDYPDTPEGRENHHAKVWVMNRAPKHMTKDQRLDLESDLFNIPSMIPAAIKRAEALSGDRYRPLHVIEQEREEGRARAARAKKERAEKPKLLYVVFVVINGKLHRQEYWGRPGRDGKFQKEEDVKLGEGELINRLPKESMIFPRPPIPCGKRVLIKGEQRTSALVVHEILTGEKLRNLPRDKGLRKPYRARIYIEGKLTHIGYYATPEERDAAQAMAKIGIYPEGFQLRSE